MRGRDGDADRSGGRAARSPGRGFRADGGKAAEPGPGTEATPAEPEPELPKIPSEFSKKKAEPDTTAAPNSRARWTWSRWMQPCWTIRVILFLEFPGGNFRVLEDNVPQKVTRVEMGQAPITVAMLIEFSSLFQRYWGQTWYQTLQLAFGFASTLQPQDYCAVIAYDIRPEMLTDFTNDRQRIEGALNRMQMASWAEANLYDALIDTTDRMSGIEGRKAIVLISSGVDTFSKFTFDQTRKALQQNGVPIYAIGLMQALRLMMTRASGSEEMDVSAGR